MSFLLIACLFSLCVPVKGQDALEKQKKTERLSVSVFVCGAFLNLSARLCVCVFSHLLHIEYQSCHSSKVGPLLCPTDTKDCLRVKIWF